MSVTVSIRRMKVSRQSLLSIPFPCAISRTCQRSWYQEERMRLFLASYLPTWVVASHAQEPVDWACRTKAGQRTWDVVFCARIRGRSTSFAQHVQDARAPNASSPALSYFARARHWYWPCLLASPRRHRESRETLNQNQAHFARLEYEYLLY